MIQLIQTQLTRWFRSEDGTTGASMVEYALIIVLIAIAAFVAVNTVGPPVSEAFSSAGDGFTP
ncbi:MAG TPA: Flp family type IVb pilin [Acidimicrobiia bacterium]|jgi:Flp pilus assembly pilin Flp|nr:Flp family type IVb pilin [Acidimicrobiia bacterium]